MLREYGDVLGTYKIEMYVYYSILFFFIAIGESGESGKSGESGNKKITMRESLICIFL